MPAPALQALEDEFRRLLRRYFPGRIPEALIKDLSGAASGYTAGQVERFARPGPWPPRRHRGPGGAAKNQQQQRREDQSA